MRLVTPKALLLENLRNGLLSCSTVLLVYYTKAEANPVVRRAGFLHCLPDQEGYFSATRCSLLWSDLFTDDDDDDDDYSVELLKTILCWLWKSDVRVDTKH